MRVDSLLMSAGPQPNSLGFAEVVSDDCVCCFGVPEPMFFQRLLELVARSKVVFVVFKALTCVAITFACAPFLKDQQSKEEDDKRPLRCNFLYIVDINQI
jgi:hypothetical protein